MKRTIVCILLAGLLIAACATTGSGAGLSLQDAIEQTAEQIAAELPKGSRLAIVAFEADSDSLSEFIRAELTTALIKRGIEVVARSSIEYINQELDFQMSGYVSDETALSVGKFAAAELLITGQLRHLGNAYRFSATVTRVEEATHVNASSLDVRDDRSTRNMIAALDRQGATVSQPEPAATAVPQTAGAFLDRGILLAMNGEYEIAILDFTEAIQLAPNMVSAYILRARALFASVAIVTSVGENFSGVGSFSTGGNVSAEQAQVYDLAIEDLNTVIRLDPNNAMAYLERGTAYSDKGDHDRAIADYNQAIRLYPNNANGYIARGIVYNIRQDYDRAIADHTQAIRLDPNNFYAYYNRGNVYYYKNDFDRAIADYTQAIRLAPNFASTYNNRGQAHGNKGDFDRAIADFTQAISLNPDDANAYYYRAIVNANKQDYDRAIADFTQVIRIAPNAAEGYYNRGQAYGNKGDFDRAVADFTQVIRLAPNATEGYYNRGLAYFSKQDYDRAIADYTQAIGLYPNAAEAYFQRGGAYLYKQDYDRAIADFTQVIRLAPNADNAYYFRGMAYYYKRDYNRAIADLEAALRINPNDADARQWLENARQARGR